MGMQKQIQNGRDPILAFRCPPSLYRVVEQLAKASERTVSQVARLALLQWIERQGKGTR